MLDIGEEGKMKPTKVPHSKIKNGFVGDNPIDQYQKWSRSFRCTCVGTIGHV